MGVEWREREGESKKARHLSAFLVIQFPTLQSSSTIDVQQNRCVLMFIYR